ncbi:MAG: restriction endonuclease subunit S [Chryseobacterium sp.]|uniref:restriction endonuclease subunit S n=1 Tax=Chryseobacterium sp. TaxID=1871047 RepID=UPI003D0EFA33
MGFWNSEIQLAELINKNIISLGRGRIISSIDLQKKPGIYPVYSSSSQKGGLFGLYSEFDFNEELITWSVDGGGYFFYRPKHKFSVTNVSGVLKLNGPDFDYKFLYYSLVYQHSKEVFDYVDKAHPSVIKKRYSIPNISLEEQKKIAKILSKVDEVIDSTEKLIQKYEQLKVGLMQDLLTKGIDENGNIRSEVTHQFKDSPLGRIPLEWQFEPIENHLEFITSGSRGWAPYYSDSGSTFIRITNLERKNISINLSDIQYVLLPTRAEGIRSALKKEDILISITAELGLIGYVDKTLDAYINQHIALVRLKPNTLNTKLIAYFLSSDYGQLLFANLNDGGAKAGLNLPTIRKIPIPIIGEAESTKIVMKIESVEKLIIVCSKQLYKLQNQKSGLMQDLLSGKVRVNY